jgi:hypothetical protein
MNFNLLNPDTVKLARPPVVFTNLQLFFNPKQTTRILIEEALPLLKLGLMQDFH